MSKTSLIIILVSLVIFIAFFAWQTQAYKVPEPNYQVVKNDGAIEIRDYPPIIVAQIQVEGERYTAINSGFKILADYIFGNNIAKEKIAMTSPVIQQKHGEKWDVRFVMPTESTLKSLPKPNNKDIFIFEIPATKYVVIQFSGRNTQTNLDYHYALLLDYLSKHQLKQKGDPIFAFYNPPWILPFLRRNEIMVKID